MAETSSLLNCRRGNSTASSNLVLSAKPRNGCDESRNRFFVGTHASSLADGRQQKNDRAPSQGAVSRLGSVPAGAKRCTSKASESCRPRCSLPPLLIPTPESRALPRHSPPLLARSPSTVKENRLGYHKSNPTD